MNVPSITFKREKGKRSMVLFALCRILLGVHGGALHWNGGASNFCPLLLLRLSSTSSFISTFSKYSLFFKWVRDGTGFGRGDELEGRTMKARQESAATSIYNRRFIASTESNVIASLHDDYH